MNSNYVLRRLVRHFMPEAWARFLLRHRWIIKPGLETSDPEAAVERYIRKLSDHGRSITDQRVLVFGYGGRFAVGIGLLERGAEHVILCDHIESLDNERNLQLLPQFKNYLASKNGEVRPYSQFITLIHGDIRMEEVKGRFGNVDYVLSSSVFEHLDDVPGITRALTAITKPDGLQIHFIDLRDHYFKYPFEMLTFSDAIWKRYLNPTSNLNRFRMKDYQEQFNKHFDMVKIDALARDPEAFENVRQRIRPDFISGDSFADSVTLILLIAGKPKKQA